MTNYDYDNETLKEHFARATMNMSFLKKLEFLFWTFVIVIIGCCIDFYEKIYLNISKIKERIIRKA